MPRIAASCIAVATVIFSIVFNTIHYPIVWEMAAPARLTGLEESLPSNDPSPSDRPSETTDAIVAEASKAAPATASIGGSEVANAFEAAAFPEVAPQGSPETAADTSPELPSTKEDGVANERPLSDDALTYTRKSTSEAEEESPVDPSSFEPYASDAENPLAHLGTVEGVEEASREGSNEPATSMTTDPSSSGDNPPPISMEPVASTKTEEVFDNHNEWPAEVAPSRRYAQSMTDSPPTESLKATTRPLVPVPPRDARGAGTIHADQEYPEERMVSDRMERLPTVGATSPFSSDLLADPLSAYPDTGF